MSFEDTFLMTAMLTVFIPVGMALLCYKGLERNLKALAWFLAFSFLFDVKQYIPALEPYKAHFYITFGLLQLLFYIWFVCQLAPQLLITPYKKTVAGLFTLLWVLCYLPLVFKRDVSWQNSVFIVAQAILLAYMAAFALLDLTKQQVPLMSHRHFWFFLGIFIYFFMNTFLYAFLHATFRDQIWLLHSIFDITKNLLFAIGFYIAARPRQL